MDGALLCSLIPVSVSVSVSTTSTSFSPSPQFSFFRRNLQFDLAVQKQNRFTSKLRSFSSSVVVSFHESGIEELENRKFELLTAVIDTQRGLTADTHQRSSIEEALVKVESFNAGKPVDLDVLDGTWRLQYTTAPDVLMLLQSSTLPFLEVDQIYQRFECRGSDQSGEGIVRNVVRWSIPRLLEEREGATLIVSAKFSLVSKRNIYLEFEEIAVQNINISEGLQALIAPAIFPRSFFSFQILQFIRSFKAEIPVQSSNRRSVGGLYYLSYLDNNMLLGRAVGGGGTFIFTRAPALN